MLHNAGQTVLMKDVSGKEASWSVVYGRYELLPMVLYVKQASFWLSYMPSKEGPMAKDRCKERHQHDPRGQTYLTLCGVQKVGMVKNLCLLACLPRVPTLDN